MKLGHLQGHLSNETDRNRQRPPEANCARSHEAPSVWNAGGLVEGDRGESPVLKAPPPRRDTVWAMASTGDTEATAGGS